MNLLLYLKMKRRKKRKLSLTPEKREQERVKGCIFAFIILITGTYCYIYDSYTDYEHPLVPNLLNLITGQNIIPDEQPMFLQDYYIKNQSMKDIVYIDGHYTVLYDISKQPENKISGMFLYMIILFLPLFIIILGNFKVKKLSVYRVKLFFKQIKQNMNNDYKESKQ